MTDPPERIVWFYGRHQPDLFCSLTEEIPFESICCFRQSKFIYAGKKCRTISLNSTCIVVYKNPRDQTQIHHLACQMFPSKPKFLQAVYEEETKDPYRYLFLDFHPNSPEFARVRGNVFPCNLVEDPCCLYLPKDMRI